MKVTRAKTAYRSTYRIVFSTWSGTPGRGCGSASVVVAFISKQNLAMNFVCRRHAANRPLRVPKRAVLFVLLSIEYCIRFIHSFSIRRATPWTVVEALPLRPLAPKVVDTGLTNNTNYYCLCVRQYLRSSNIRYMSIVVAYSQASELVEPTIRTVTELCSMRLLESLGFSIPRCSKRSLSQWMLRSTTICNAVLIISPV